MPQQFMNQLWVDLKHPLAFHIGIVSVSTERLSTVNCLILNNWILQSTGILEGGAKKESCPGECVCFCHFVTWRGRDKKGFTDLRQQAQILEQTEFYNCKSWR